MMESRFTTGVILAAGITSTLAGGLLAQDDPTLPMRYRATVMALNALPPGTVKVEVAGAGSTTDPTGLPPVPAPQTPGTTPPTRGTRSAAKSALLAITIDRIEFRLPRSGRGEDSLVAATRAGFDDEGRIVALAMPMSSGTQRLTNVEREASEKGEGEN